MTSREQEVIATSKSIITSSGSTMMSVRQFLAEYLTNEGEIFPNQELGYSSPEAFLYQKAGFKQPKVGYVSFKSEQASHVAAMIDSQKTKPRTVSVAAVKKAMIDLRNKAPGATVTAPTARKPTAPFESRPRPSPHLDNPTFERRLPNYGQSQQSDNYSQDLEKFRAQILANNKAQQNSTSSNSLHQPKARVIFSNRGALEAYCEKMVPRETLLLLEQILIKFGNQGITIPEIIRCFNSRSNEPLDFAGLSVEDFFTGLPELCRIQRNSQDIYLFPSKTQTSILPPGSSRVPPGFSAEIPKRTVSDTGSKPKREPTMSNVNQIASAMAGISRVFSGSQLTLEAFREELRDFGGVETARWLALQSSTKLVEFLQHASEAELTIKDNGNLIEFGALLAPYARPASEYEEEPPVEDYSTKFNYLTCSPHSDAFICHTLRKGETVDILINDIFLDGDHLHANFTLGAEISARKALMQHLAETYSRPPHNSPVSFETLYQGLPAVVQDEEGLNHRVVIKNISDQQEIEVYQVDLGYYFHVPCDRVRAIVKDLLDIPAFAQIAVFADVRPGEGKSKITARTIQILQAELLNHVIKAFVFDYQPSTFSSQISIRSVLEPLVGKSISFIDISHISCKSEPDRQGNQESSQPEAESPTPSDHVNASSTGGSRSSTPPTEPLSEPFETQTPKPNGNTQPQAQASSSRSTEQPAGAAAAAAGSQTNRCNRSSSISDSFSIKSLTLVNCETIHIIECGQGRFVPTSSISHLLSLEADDFVRLLRAYGVSPQHQYIVTKELRKSLMKSDCPMASECEYIIPLICVAPLLAAFLCARDDKGIAKRERKLIRGLRALANGVEIADDS